MNALRMLLAASAVAATLAALPRAAQAQRDTPAATDRAMATRAELEAEVASLENDRKADQQALARARNRLTQGDFRPGDRVWLNVQQDTALSDTFTVWPDMSLHLPSPTVGTISLAGTLRSELQDKMQTYVARFLRNPTVRARPLVRLSVQGEVRYAGYYAVPADAELSDVFMAAGGNTPNAKPEAARLEREGRIYMNATELESALAGGRTLDEAGVHEGDQFVVPRKGNMGDGLRMTWLLVSLTGGVIALSRAIH